MSFLKPYALEFAAIYSFVLLMIGFVSGVFVWRWYKGPTAQSDYDALSEEVDYLEDACNRLVDAVSVLWQRTHPSSESVPHDHKVKAIRSAERSRWKKVYRKTLGRIVKRRKPKIIGTYPLKSRLEASYKRLTQQTDKIRNATLLISSGSNSSSKAEAPEDDNHPLVDFHDQRAKQSSIGSTGVDVQPTGEVVKAKAESSHESASKTRSNSSARARPAGPKSAVSIMVELYNRAVSDSQVREQLREQYQPIRIGTVNAVERRQNPTVTIKAEFREAADGDFFAFPISGSNDHAVFPRLGLTVGPVSYHAGGLGEMFGNPDYDPKQSYSRYQVREAALFKRDGNNWELVHPGNLDLGAPD